MRDNSKDKTIERNYVQKYQFLIKEYQLVKQKKHPRFRFVSDFYKHHNTCRQTFLKYYGRYMNANSNQMALMPGKRGPRYTSRRPCEEIEGKVIAEREKGCNKHEIHSILLPLLKENTPSPSGIYNICKRHGKNRLTKPMQETKRRIIKEKAGELGHIDCHYLSKDIIPGGKRYYLVSIIDSCTRVAWAEVVEDIKSLTVMFSTLRCLNYLTHHYNIRFAEVLTDNGSEFGNRASLKKGEHPFERMLMELSIKHRHTRPYRPQTNGKIERFWRTLNEDLIEDTYFESIAHFKDELFKYLVYYNKMRPHQSLNGLTPDKFNESCQRIT